MVKSVTLREAWSGEADCLNCSLRTSVLFAGLSEADFQHIHDPIDQFNLKPGTHLYHVGDAAEHMFTVRSGILKLVQYLPDGSQRIVRIVRTTDVLGLEAMLEGMGYQHAAIALHASEICRFPARIVRELAASNPELHRELIARWQRALNEADAWLTELSTGSARQRIARLLLRLVDGERDQCQLFSREDVGAMLGITTETASRTIAEFKRQGLMREASTNQFTLDVPNLKRIAEE
ncbi:Crp/Fnr family transcriptional regulator [Thiocapsa imhoffii]|uniref:Crp/Fnr family transcriptional regulator n=1 Tax=Thiocapsa imhoffii TaxID=382777 RepID=A0A9X1B9X1_9GAMM|nr:Crp/Fnr family transcriptional regulator [Thiocapsa imhoffii]MBK1646384.1 Crp/Fnr family transcriptional regulator [Thiocapsa imhoffii]